MPFFLSFPAGKNLYTNEYVAIKLVSLFVVRGGGGERLGSLREQLFALPSLLKWVGTGCGRGAALAARNRGHAGSQRHSRWGDAALGRTAGALLHQELAVACSQHPFSWYQRRELLESVVPPTPALCTPLPAPGSLWRGWIRLPCGLVSSWFPLPVPWVFVFILHCCFSPLNAVSPCCCQPVKEGSASQTS